MFDDGGQILTEGVSLLRELTRTLASHTDARAKVAAWRKTYPGLRADLLVYRGPATDRTEYDLLLGMLDDGADTVALSWIPDRGEPWSICYADHWASNYLVTVNDIPTTVQQALLYLRSVQENRPDLMDIIIQHHLLSARVQETPPSVSPLEIQVAADRFRQAHGLLNEAKTNQWLTEMQLSMEQFRQLIKENVQRRKIRDALVEERIESYFITHPSKFEEVRLFHAQIPDGVAAEKLAADARSQGDLRGVFESRFCELQGDTGWAGTIQSSVACQLPAWIAEGELGVIVGPILENNAWSVVQIISRVAAPGLQGATRAAAADAVFEQWVAEQRSRALIRWHWTA